MNLTKVSIHDLFGIFTHTIPLNIEEHITIIHGPNGLGKTFILKMLRSFYSGNYYELHKTLFKFIVLEFDDGSQLKISKMDRSEEENSNQDSTNNKLQFEFTQSDGQKRTFIHSSEHPENLNLPLGILEKEIPGLSRIGSYTWMYFPTQEELSLQSVIERFGDKLPIATTRKVNEPLWLQELRDAIDIYFIGTQRLLSFAHKTDRSEIDVHAPISSIRNYSKALSGTIQKTMAKYASLSQALDRKFPKKLIEAQQQNDLSRASLQEQFELLEEKRLSLINAGLLTDAGSDDTMTGVAQMGDENIHVLSVYVKDMGEKLAVFDDLQARIELLLKIINSKFLYKNVQIDNKAGFVFKTTDGQNLQASKLSSGEQHMLVLLYEFLFEVQPDALILIDEPELSLHVAWQQRFIRDLEEISLLIGFNILIATHSPQIIHDRWDLTVELKGPDDEAISNSP